MRIFVLNLIFSGLFIMSGCSLIAHEVKIKNHSLARVDKSDMERIIGDDINLPLIANYPGNNFIVLQFESEEDLLDLIGDMHANLSSDSYFCESPTQEVILLVPGIYWNGSNIKRLKLEDRSRRTIGGDQQDWYKYKMVLFPAWNIDREAPGSPGGGSYFMKYDLSKDPKDICVSISGGNMVQTIQSNTLMITAAEIQKVLKTGGGFD